MLDMNSESNFKRGFKDTASDNPAEAALHLIQATMTSRNRERNQDDCMYPIRTVFAKVVDDLKSKEGSDMDSPSVAAAIQIARSSLDI